MYRALILFLLILFPFKNLSATPCSDGSKSIPLESKIASASLSSNIFGTQSSVKGVAKALLKNAIENGSLNNQSQRCPTQCSRPESRIYLKAIPSKFLSDYEDKDKCTSYLNNTKRDPLTFDVFKFADIDEFADLFSDFSRGKGPKGEELYKRCDGECSPQFTLKIKSLDDGTFVQDTDVVCGHARDQDDDTYIVSTTLVVNCG